MVIIKANYGRATYVSWGNTTLDLIDIDSGGITMTTEAIENTRYGDGIRQFLPGYTDPGSISITVSTDRPADVALLRNNAATRVVSTFSIVLPTGLQKTYTGFITSFTDFLDKHGLYTLKITIKLSGMPTETAYPLYTVVPVNNSSLIRGSSYGLYLIPGGGTAEGATGGEGAVWELVDAHHVDTTIVGNTLIIASAEVGGETGKITVKATIYPTAQASSVTSTATYTITMPSPTSVAISGIDTIDFDAAAEGATTTAVYTAAVYPTGAAQTTSWTLTKADGSAADTGIAINAGTVTITKAQYRVPNGDHEYIITAKATGSTATIQNIKYITVHVYGRAP